MNARVTAFVVLAVALAALFVRLGFWQLDRLEQRRAVNRRVEAQFALPPVPIESVHGDTSFRRAFVTGAADLDREVLHVGRSRNGSPGVHILTPMRRPGSDTAVLVNRGWVYAPDAATTDPSRWREDRDSWSGFVMPLSADSARGTPPTGRRVRALNAEALQPLFPYPIAPVILVAEDSASPDAPVRLARPALDDGPHLSYAIQWFCFAAIALVGSAIVVRRMTQPTTRGATGA